MDNIFRILIVDAEKDLGELMHILLKDSDVQISQASTLKDGKIFWERESPSILLLDNNLPDGQGVELVEENKHLLLRCKVIMVTADTKLEIKKRAEAAGILYFIQKPFNLKEIRKLVNNIFACV